MNDVTPTSSPIREPSTKRWDVVFGLIAIARAGAEVLPLAAIVVLERTPWRSRGLEQRVSDMIFDHGFALDVLALVFAIAAAASGRRGRRLGVGAVVLVVISYLLMAFA